MATVTTTNLAWDATWSNAPVMPDALNVVIYGRDRALQHGNSVVSTSSETSSVYNDASGDTISLSQQAQTYMDDQSTGIPETSTLSKIYSAIVQVISSSTTSDTEKWNAFVADQRLAAQSSRNDGVWGANINLFGDETAMATPYMQTIKAAYEYFDHNDAPTNQLQRNIKGLFNEESEADVDEIWGNASLSINVKQTVAQTDSGTITSFSISSELSGKMEYAPGTGPNTPDAQKVSVEDSGLPTSFSASASDQTVKISGKAYDLKAEFDKEVVEELFGSSTRKDRTAQQQADAAAKAADTSGTGSGASAASAVAA